MKSLHPDILNMKRLTDISLEGCDGLQSPPTQVCERGMDSIKQYYKDLTLGEGRNVPAVTIAVVGEAMAGKTSLIKTFQSKDKKRVMTHRGPDSKKDLATVVFKLEEVAKPDMILKFIDVGGLSLIHI